MIKNRFVLKCPNCNHLLDYKEDGNKFNCPECRVCYAESDLKLQKQDQWHDGYNRGFKVGLKCAISNLRNTANCYEKLIMEN